MKDGVIGDDEHLTDLYDKEIGLEEFADSFKSGNKTLGIVLIVIGLILILICVLPLFKKKKKVTAEVKSEKRKIGKN